MSRYRPLGLALALFAAACGERTAAEVTQPTSIDRCGMAVAGLPSSVAAAGARVAASVTTTRECAWSVTSDSSWIRTEPTTGQGEAPLTVVVAENQAAIRRSGTITVNDTRLTVTQEPAPCRYGLEPSGARVGPEGGQLVVSVSAVAGCAWVASSAAPWVQVIRGGGNGSGTAELHADVNRMAERRATIAIAGLSLIVEQAAASSGPSPAPGPSPTPSPPAPEPKPSSPVSFKGVVGNLSGSCPSLGFTANGYQIRTDAETRYKGGECRDVRNGVEADVDGTLNGSGVVYAAKMDLKKNKKD